MNNIVSTIIIIVMIAILLAGAFLAWWIENGPNHKDKNNENNDSHAENTIEKKDRQ